MMALFARHRRLIIVLAVVTVLVIGASSVFVVLWRRSGAHEVSVDDARGRFRQNSSTRPAQASVLRPAAGVYLYRGSGREKLSLPPKSQDQGPRMPGTVTYDANGCWTFHIDYSSAHWQIWDYCPRAGGLVELGGQTFENWDFVFTAYETKSTFTCDPALVTIRATMHPGDTWHQRCRGTSSGTEGEAITAGPYTFVGDDVVVVGDVRVPAYHFRQERTLTGSQTGSQTTDQWFARETGLPLRNERKVTVHANTVVGSITYTETGRFQLTSLQPQR
jgi:hypothetical protein